MTEVRDNTLKLEKFLLAQEEPKSIYTQLGNSPDAAQYGEVGSPTTAAFTIIMKKGANADRFVEKVNEQKNDYPKANLTAAAGSLTGGSSTAITIDVIGDKITGY